MFLPVQMQDVFLSGGGSTAGATTLTIKSLKKPTTDTLITMADFGTIGYCTAEPGTSKEENFSFTGVTQNANGTATLTGVTSGIDFVSPYSSTVALRYGHAGNSLIRFSNSAVFYSQFVTDGGNEVISGVFTFTNPNYPRMDTATPPPTLDTELATKKYVDDIAIAGAPDATTTVKGIVEIATQAEVNAGTAIGGTGASLVVRPSELAVIVQNSTTSYGVDSVGTDAYAITLVPAITAYVDGQQFSFKAGAANTGTATLNVGALGAITIKKNHDQNLETGDIELGSQVIVIYDSVGPVFQLQTQQASMPSTISLGAINNFTAVGMPGVLTLTAGEIMDGTVTPVPVYQSTVDSKVYKADASFPNNESDGFLGFVISSVAANASVTVYMSGLLTIPTQTLDNVIGSTADQVCNSSTADVATSMNAVSYKISQGIMIGANVGNISSVKFNLTINTAVGATTSVSIHAINLTTGKPTGAALATSDTVAVTTATKTYTFATPYAVVPGQYYCLVLNVVAITSGLFQVMGSNASTTTSQGYRILGINSVSFESTDTGSTWITLNTQPWFETYTTSKLFTPGDPIYLSETTGAYTLTRPTSASVMALKIGKLISSTKVEIGWTPRIVAKGVLAGVINSYGGGAHVDVAFVGMPNHATEAYVYAVNDQITDTFASTILLNNTITTAVSGLVTFSLVSGVLKVSLTAASNSNTLTVSVIFKS